MLARLEANGDVAMLVPLSVLSQHCNPFKSVVWHHDLTRPVTRRQVAARIAENDLKNSGQDHAARIANFVVHSWRDAIHIDVGVPSHGFHPGWFVEDGNHRLAAAIYENHANIWAQISGDWGYAEELGFLLPESRIAAERLINIA
jgi:hypothetical protein